MLIPVCTKRNKLGRNVHIQRNYNNDHEHATTLMRPNFETAGAMETDAE